MKLIALRPLSGDYGFVNADGIFEAHDCDAIKLMARGLARKYKEPSILSKMFAPPENKMEPPADNKAATVVASAEQVQPVVREPIIPHRFRRAKR